MKIVCFDEHRVGVLADGIVHDVSALLDERWRGTPYAPNELIARWDELCEEVGDVAASPASAVALNDVRLLAPVPRPRQLLAAPLNYHPHVAEMAVSRHAPDAFATDQSPLSLGFFVKASGSICGPQDAIELPPLEGRAFHHEVELGVVIGRAARGLRPEQVREHVFGYVCLLDITLRTEGAHQEERPLRKSFETFTPIGPAITTADEVPDPGCLELRLWVNGELRQSATTADLIVGVDELIAQASNVMTLHPGDVYATGTPEGVGPIVPGDVVRATVEGVGELELPVRRRDW